MSKKTYRKDKTCLNCKHVVDQKFCPNCGQENTDVRKTFHHLFIHFFEDLTHYENAFWRTIKNLLFKPAALTKEYLSGKRLSYLAPVRLYIFISFVTFLVVALIAKPNIEKVKEKIEKNSNSSTLNSQELKVKELEKNGFLDKKDADSIIYYLKNAKKEQKNSNYFNFGYDSVEKMDSVRKINKNEIDDFEYWLNKKAILVGKNNTKAEIITKGIASAQNNFPKVMIIYMPIFALFLWLFHNKKRWYYFDHGIFTLHYFSFLLLMFLIIFIKNWFFNIWIHIPLIHFINAAINFIGFLWMFYYFFPAHHRFYGESRWKSFFKSSILFFINGFFIIIILILFLIYSFISIH